jgi:hypothetical protein
VANRLADQVFAPDRLIELVSSYLDQVKADTRLHRSQLGRLKSDLTETKGAVTVWSAWLRPG